MSDNTSLAVRMTLGGSAGCCATMFVHPMDVLKNRMQMSGEGGKGKEYKSSLHLLAAVVRNEGVLAAYSGLSAGLLRQVTYASARLGIYTWLFAKMTKKGADGKMKPPNFAQKMGFALIAGSAAAGVGTPAEVCLVRMAVDGRLPPEKRRNYKNVVDALVRIAKEEGLGGNGLFRGLWPTIIRSCVTNASQLVTYSQSKEFVLSMGIVRDGLPAHLAAGMISGLATAFFSLPFDMAKTRVQNMRVINGKPEYKGMGDVLMRVMKNEGFGSLWKGFTPYYMRIGPHTILTLMFLEQFNGLYARHVLGKEKLGGL